MQAHRNHQGVFQGFGQEKVLETARPPQKRAEGACGGAAKECYGKYG